MDALLAARSQMAMSLAFHTIFAAIGVTLQLLVAALAAGALLLFPSYYYLIRVFKAE